MEIWIIFPISKIEKINTASFTVQNIIFKVEHYAVLAYFKIYMCRGLYNVGVGMLDPDPNPDLASGYDKTIY